MGILQVKTIVNCYKCVDLSIEIQEFSERWCSKEKCACIWRVETKEFQKLETN